MESSLQYLQQRTSWFTSERRGWVAVVVLASAVSFGLGNGHTTQGALTHVSDQLGETKSALNTVVKKDIPALKAQAGCEKWRGDVNGDLAQKPIIVSPSAIQADNCPHPKIILPSLATK